MKKILAFAVIGLVFLNSCKKDDPFPTPVEPSQTQYKINFFASDFQNAPFDTFYSDLIVVVNGDTLDGNMSKYGTNFEWDTICDCMDSMDYPFPESQLTYSIQLNTLYDIKVLDANTKSLFYNIKGQFQLEPQPQVYDRDVFFHQSEEYFYEDVANTILGTTNVNMGEAFLEDGNIYRNSNCFFMFSLTY